MTFLLDTDVLSALRSLTVVTRNVSHFEPTGVAVFNPFAYTEG